MIIEILLWAILPALLISIYIAKNGYPLVPNIINTIRSVKDLFLKDWKTSADIYLPNGDIPKIGDFFTNKINRYERKN